MCSKVRWKGHTLFCHLAFWISILGTNRLIYTHPNLKMFIHGNIIMILKLITVTRQCFCNKNMYYFYKMLNLSSLRIFNILVRRAMKLLKQHRQLMLPLVTSKMLKINAYFWRYFGHRTWESEMDLTWKSPFWGPAFRVH